MLHFTKTGWIFWILLLAAAAVQAGEEGTRLAVPGQPDPRVRKYVLPTRIVWQSKEPTASVDKAEALLAAPNGQATLDAKEFCTLHHKGSVPGVLLDFGRELHGGLQIVVEKSKTGKTQNKPIRLRVRFGESVSEAMSELGEPKNATNDHAVRDQTVLVPWYGSAEIGNTGFRFARVDLADPDGFVQLKAVRAVFLYRDLPYLGSFRSNDERLNRIWQVGAYTVQLNMQDFLWDGVKRDRLVWIGDMHPETMTIGAVFGSPDVVPKSLDLIRDETPLPKWMNGISSYSMWWILIHHGWHRQTGDLDYLKRQQPYLVALLDQLQKSVGPDGQETLTGMRFLDWPSSENKPAIHAGLQAMMVLTMDAGADLCDALGDSAAKARCQATAAALRKHVPDHGNSKQAAALLALAKLGDAARLNREVLAPGNAQGMSTFYGYYVLQARALAGDHQGCLDVIREFWGAMLDLGATTFWEDFDIHWIDKNAGNSSVGRIDELVPSGKKDIHGDFGAYCYKGFRHSLCHGWASGPTAWLSEHVLGVQIVEPGGAVVRVRPHLGDLQWVEGKYPTPRGVIRVRHDRQADGSVKSNIEAPPGVRVLRD